MVEKSYELVEKSRIDPPEWLLLPQDEFAVSDGSYLLVAEKKDLNDIELGLQQVRSMSLVRAQRLYVDFLFQSAGIKQQKPEMVARIVNFMNQRGASLFEVKDMYFEKYKRNQSNASQSQVTHFFNVYILLQIPMQVHKEFLQKVKSQFKLDQSKSLFSLKDDSEASL